MESGACGWLRHSPGARLGAGGCGAGRAGCAPAGCGGGVGGCWEGAEGTVLGVSLCPLLQAAALPLEPQTRHHQCCALPGAGGQGRLPLRPRCPLSQHGEQLPAPRLPTSQPRAGVSVPFAVRHSSACPPAAGWGPGEAAPAPGTPLARRAGGGGDAVADLLLPLGRHAPQPGLAPRENSHQAGRLATVGLHAGLWLPPPVRQRGLVGAAGGDVGTTCGGTWGSVKQPLCVQLGGCCGVQGVWDTVGLGVAVLVHLCPADSWLCSTHWSRSA